MTPDEYKAAIAKPKKGRFTRSPAAERTIDGIVFDSKLEMQRYADLKRKEQAGLIFDLRRQQSYKVEIKGLPYCKFTPDFEYLVDGRVVIEEAKSSGTAKDPAYRLRRKAFELYYGIKVTEVIR